MAILQSLKKHNRLNETLFLGGLSILCFSISIFRLEYSSTGHFLFLNWNLFLAFIPWALSSLLIVNDNLRRKPLLLAGVAAVWLLFFPNAPYILTDLFHLKLVTSMPVWFDLMLILCFAWTGLLFGFMSLWDIEKIAAGILHEKAIPVLSAVLLFLGSFGVYVGRYLRWNSWDIIREPYGLYYDISDRVVNPFNHPRTWGMTILLGLFLNILYWSFRLIRKRT